MLKFRLGKATFPLPQTPWSLRATIMLQSRIPVPRAAHLPWAPHAAYTAETQPSYPEELHRVLPQCTAGLIARCPKVFRKASPVDTRSQGRPAEDELRDSLLATAAADPAGPHPLAFPSARFSPAPGAAIL